MTKKTLVILRFYGPIVVLLSLFGLFSIDRNASAAMPTPTDTRTPTRTPTLTLTLTSTNNLYPPPATQYFISPDPSQNFEVYLPLLFRDLLFTTSYYMNTVDANILYDMGCELGQRDFYMPGDQNSVIILDFAYPYYQSGNYGTILFGTYAFVSTTDIGNAVKNFATGYHNCSDEYSRITIAIGTNNCGPEICLGSEVTYQHGKAWAIMVNDINTFLMNNEYLQVIVGGASDIEIAWNNPTTTLNWVSGYDSVNLYAFYDYGDAQGCPTYRTNGVNGYCDNGWYQDDVWYVSWGSGASKPLPLIYATSGENADQWYSLSAYAYDAHGARMVIKGSVTQYQACQQIGTWCQEYNVDNTPEEGYRQLRNALNADPDTAQELLWATDMKWK